MLQNCCYPEPEPGAGARSKLERLHNIGPDKPWQSYRGLAGRPGAGWPRPPPGSSPPPRRRSSTGCAPPRWRGGSSGLNSQALLLLFTANDHAVTVTQATWILIIRSSEKIRKQILIVLFIYFNVTFPNNRSIYFNFFSSCFSHHFKA